MLGDAQIPERIEALPNSKQRIMQTVRRRQIFSERIAVNQRRIRMQKRQECRGHSRIKHAQRCGERHGDLPVRPGCELPQHS